MLTKNQKVIQNMKNLREWTNECLGSIDDPKTSFWIGYQHMKLREAIDSLLESMAHNASMEDLPQLGKRQGISLQLVVDNNQRDSVLPHPKGIKVNLPMLEAGDLLINYKT